MCMSLQSILLMGTPLFSVKLFEYIYIQFPDLEYTVMTKVDQSVGRGLKISFCPVKQWALSCDFSVIQPNDKKELLASVQSINPDLIIICAYGVILPKDITDSYHCINIHTSLLPKFRGASPIQAALLNHDKETGVTLMKVNEKMDSGDIISQLKTDILTDDTYGTLLDRLGNLSRLLVFDYIHCLLNNETIKSIKQNDSDATYCQKIEKDMCLLTDTLSAQDVFGRVRALSPKPGAYVLVNGQRVKILSGKIENGYFIPVSIQPEGKSIMSYNDYRLGKPEILF